MRRPNPFSEKCREIREAEPHQQADEMLTDGPKAEEDTEKRMTMQDVTAFQID